MTTWSIRVHGELATEDRAALDQASISVIGEGGYSSFSDRVGLVDPPAVPSFSLMLDADTADAARQKVVAALGADGPFAVDQPERIG